MVLLRGRLVSGGARLGRLSTCRGCYLGTWLIDIRDVTDLPDGDRPLAANVARERDAPGEDGAESVPVAGQERDVDEQPGHPAWESAELQPPDRNDSTSPGDVGSGAEVAVLKWLGPGAAVDLGFDPLSRMVAGLHGHL